MIRLVAALGLVCVLSYVFYPEESRFVLTRLGTEARSAVVGVRGAVRDAMSGKAQSPHAAGTSAPARGSARH